MPKFVSFEQFMQETKAAKPATPGQSGYVVNAASSFAAADAGRAEVENMKQYILRYYNDGDVTVKKSYLDSAGHHFDCIPVDEQPGARGMSAADLKKRLAPPAYSSHTGASATAANAVATPSSAASQAFAQMVDQVGHTKQCPDGCVPVRRLTLDNLTQFSSMQDFFRKPPWRGKQELEQRNVTAGSFTTGVGGIEGRYHAHAAWYGQRGSDAFSGAGSWMNLWGPNPGPSDFSLSQHWIVATTPDPATGREKALQTIEGGWIVSPARYGPKPVLFIFITADGYGPISGWNGYLGNVSTPGDVTSQTYFVVYDKQSHRYSPGGVLDPASTPGTSTQVGFRMQWQRNADTGDWWLFVGGDSLGVEPIGFVRHEVFGGGPLAQPGMLANVVDFGGEVQNSRMIGAGPMGSGQLAAAGFGQAAFQKQIVALSGSGSSVPANLAPDTPQDCPPNFYTMQVGANDPTWGTFLFYGGPGSG
jgi:hypothetical protein